MAAVDQLMARDEAGRSPELDGVREGVQENITETIDAARSGDEKASSKLVSLLYDELRRLARSLLARRPPGQTIQATALVHEAYLKIARKGKKDWEGRGQFFEAAAGAMRDILVDSARRKAALKRGGDRKKVPLEEEVVAIDPPSDDVLAVHEALNRLEQLDARKGKIVLLRYFCGLTMPEIAEALGLSRATVEREWAFTKAWLSRALSSDSGIWQ